MEDSIVVEAGQLDVRPDLQRRWGQPPLDVLDDGAPHFLGQDGGALLPADCNGLREHVLWRRNHLRESIVGVAVLLVQWPREGLVEVLEVCVGRLRGVARDCVN